MVSRYTVATIQKVFRCQYVFCRYSAERTIHWDDSVGIQYSRICSVSMNYVGIQWSVGIL